MITKSTFVSQLSYSLGVGLLAWMAFFVTAHTEFTRAGAESVVLVVTEVTITPSPTASSVPTDPSQTETYGVPVPPSATATPSCTPTPTATPRPTRTWAPLFTQTATPTESATPTDTTAPVPTPTETVETLIGPPPDPDLTPPPTPTRYGPGGGH